jgi:hypothetical protein
VAATIAVAASDPLFANLTNGLVLHLAFDGDYQDSSSRGNHGTPMGTPVIEAGKIGSGALRYIVEKDSSGITNNSFVTLGSPADLQFGTTNFSVAYWIKFLSPTVDLPVFCNNNCGEGCIGFYFGPSVYADGRWAWSLADSSYAGPSAEGTNVISDGTWHHIVSTFDRSGDAVTFQDGVLVDKRPITTFTASLDTGNPVNIGQVGTADYAVNYTAVVDDLGVWLRPLTQAEAESIYRVGQNYGKSFDTYGPVKLSISSTSTGVELVWQSGTLLSSDSLTGSWTAVSGAKAPYYKVTPGTGNRFYRVQL